MYKSPRVAYSFCYRGTNPEPTKGTNMATKYNVTSEDTVVKGGFAKKGDAIAFAQSHRDDARVAVAVSTDKGTLVFEQAAPRKIKMSAPYTRVVPVPDEVIERIDGARVAYKRGPKARQFALLDDAKGDYRIWDIERRETVDVEVETTRDAGRWFADERRAYADATPVDA